MKKRHAICIVVDGIQASALGTYGNTIYPTPQFDSFASRSLVADWFWADSPSLPGFYRSVWNGTHALRPSPDMLQTAVLDALQQLGVRQWLVTDDMWLSAQSPNLPFDDDLLIEVRTKQVANKIEDTVLAQLFSETLERLAEWQEDNSNSNTGGLLWLHAQGLHGPWDAPTEMRFDFLDEDGLETPTFVAPPKTICDVEDPDIILAHKAAYNAQVAVLDACLGAFYQAVESLFANTETLVIVMGSRGFALGEHGTIGSKCSALFSEQLHLPLLVNICGNSIPVARHLGLVTPVDVGATLLEWFGAEAIADCKDGIALPAASEFKIRTPRKVTVSCGAHGEAAIRTPAWMLRVPPKNNLSAKMNAAELYAKPDDRWEHNDVAIRCPEIVEQLRNELQRHLECGRAGDSLPLEPMNSDLTNSMR